MENPAINPEQPFKTPEEELAFLRDKMRQIEHAQGPEKLDTDTEKVASDLVKEYKSTPEERVVAESMVLPEGEQVKLMDSLAPERHDARIIELHKLVQEKGIKNALSVVDKMDDPHLDDDFHRFLVAYIKEGYEIEGINKSSLGKALNMTLYEIQIPEKEIGKAEAMGEVIGAMENFFSNMLGVYKEKENLYFTIELAVEHVGQEVKIFSAIPNSMKSLFEKNLISFFPKVKLREILDDYNIFTDNNTSMASYVEPSKKDIFPIKTHDKFSTDPMTSILNAFSKLKHEGEGAAVQFIIRPEGDKYMFHFKEALKRLEGGADVNSAIDIDYSFGQTALKLGKELIFGAGKGGSSASKESNENDGAHELVAEAKENIKAKTSRPIVSTNMRIVVSAPSEIEAESMLNVLESPFNQFENPHANRINFKRLKKGELDKALHDFSFRLFNESYNTPLNIEELATLIHIPTEGENLSREVRQGKSGYSAAPIGVSTEGVLLGVNEGGGTKAEIFITPEDRLRHLYVIGQTGTGKTSLLKNMVVQDIKNGDGVCMIDPHGSDIVDILANIPDERIEDVIYFDPSHTARPIAMNMLEYDPAHPEQKTFVVNEMLGIFNKLFDMKTAGGPMFEQYFRNSVLLVMESPELGNTLLDVSRVLSDKSFREAKLAASKNMVVNQYWREVAEKAGGEASLANIVPYITSKLDIFMSNDIMRPIIAQEKSSFDFRNIMDEKKILLVNLSKGKLGDINANLLGLIIVGKILMASLSRSDSMHLELPPFYLYIDEFQNITTDSIATILSEARKYKLGLTIAHQFIAQLTPEIRDAVFGNVGSIVSYRVGSDDAEYLEKQFAPVFSAKDIMGIDNFHAYAKLLMSGQPVKPFDIAVPPPEKGDTDRATGIIELSRMKYGKDAADVEAAIMAKYESTKKVPGEEDGRLA